MKRVLGTLLGCMTMISAWAQDEDTLRENHVLFTVHQEALVRAIDTARARAVTRYTEAIALAEVALKKSSDVDGLLALSRTKRSLTENPHILPGRPSSEDLPDLADYYDTLTHELRAVMVRNSREKAERRHNYLSRLRRALDSSGTAETQRNLIRSYLAAIEQTSISPELPATPLTSGLSEKAAHLLSQCVPMIHRNGKWIDAEWDIDIAYSETPKGNLRFSLKENAGHIYGKIRHKNPLPSGAAYYASGSGFRTVELVDKTKRDYAVFWYLKKPTRMAEFDFSLQGNYIELYTGRTKLTPLAIIDSGPPSMKKILDDGRFDVPQAPLFPAFSMSKEHDVILFDWTNPSK